MTTLLDRLKITLADRYAIERELGAGGMALVYLAEDLRHHRRVAIKVLRPELAALVGVERFLKEIEVTAGLQHPHILPLHDSGQVDGVGFYVMPFIAGESLRDRLTREKQLPVEDAVAITRAVAGALDYAHRHGVVHRDIKPENILLHEGQPLVADFGIALAVSNAGGSRLTETGLSLGTPHYMSPEQSMGEREITGRSDIYSLGCVLYELLAGEPPFQGPTAQAIVARIITEKPRPLRANRPTVPEHVEYAVDRALEKLPADRWGTAAEFAEALIGGTAGRRYDGKGARGADTAGSPSHRPALAGWGVALLATALALWGWLRPRPLTSGPESQRYEVILPDSAPIAYRGRAPLDIWQRALALSADGSTLAYVARRDSTTLLYVRDMRQGTIRPIPETEGAYSPFFSPDGKWIGFFSGSELRKVSAEGGAPVTMAPAHFPEGASWAPDGRILVSLDEGANPAWFSPGGGSPQPLARFHGAFCEPEVLPGGEWAVGSLFPTRQLALLDLRTGELSAITLKGLVKPDSVSPGDELPAASPHWLSTGYLLYGTNGDGVLMALPFDPVQRRVLGAPVPVLEGVRREEGYGFTQYAVSDEGTLVYAPGGNAGLGRPALIDARGRVDTLSFPKAEYMNLRLSPDGKRVLVETRPEYGVVGVSILDIERGQERKLPTTGRRVGLEWWPDGRSVLVAGFDPGSRRNQPPVRYSLADGSIRTLAVPGSLWPAVSPDGKFVATADSLFHIIVSPVDSGAAQVLVEDGGNHLSFSPDGQWLAYLNIKTLEVMVASLKHPGEVYQVSTGHGEQPRWSHRGDQLFYRQGHRFLVADVDTRNGFRSGAPRRFLEGPFVRIIGWSYDATSDGRLLVVVGPSEQSAGHLGVVTNIPTRIGARQ